MNKQADILLISPSNNKMGIFSKFSFRSVPLAIGILAGYLIQNNFVPIIEDEEIEPLNYDKLKKIIENLNAPKAVGISCMTTNAKRAYELAKMIKSIDSSVKIIAGGIHPTVEPEEVLNSGNIDFVIRAEGERATLALLEKFKNQNKDYADIENLAYIQDGKIVYNETEKKLIDVNELPMFPYYIFDSSKYDLGFVLTSRGCPFNCIFCSQRAISSGKYRWRKNELVIEELEYLINEENQKTIGFFDDCFTANKARVFELCQMIRERGLHKKCSFGAQTRADRIDEELLTEMKKSGFDNLMFGFEVSSNELMTFINKGETVEDNINAIKIAKKCNFNVEATFIFGFPNESFEDRFNCLKIAKKYGIDRARFNMATPYPGTALYKMAKEQNLLNKEEGWENFNSVGVIASGLKKYKPPFCPKGVNPIDIMGQVFLANFLFYVNFDKLKALFNFTPKSSGKWFNFPKEQMFNPITWLALINLGFSVGIKTLYFLLASKECRKFFIKGFFN